MWDFYSKLLHECSCIVLLISLFSLKIEGHQKLWDLLLKHQDEVWPTLEALHCCVEEGVARTIALPVSARQLQVWVRAASQQGGAEDWRACRYVQCCHFWGGRVSCSLNTWNFTKTIADLSYWSDAQHCQPSMSFLMSSTPSLTNTINSKT